MRKQRPKMYLLVPLVLLLVFAFAFELASHGAFRQTQTHTIQSQPPADGPSIMAGNPPSSTGTQTPLGNDPIVSTAAQVSGTMTAGNSGGGSQPLIPAQGKAIIVNRANNVQELYAYENGKQVFSTPVTTGSLYLQTFLGTFHITQKLQNITMYSPWPQSSPNYYPPVHVNYALDYDGPIYIHDAPWRGVFGPGTDRPHTDPKMGQSDGSHGCVETPTSAAAWLYNWAPVGTLVEVID